MERAETRRGWRVLVLTLEFADPVFSGNGVYARSIVRNLRTHVTPRAAASPEGDDPIAPSPLTSVMVICGCPEGRVLAPSKDDVGQDKGAARAAAPPTPIAGNGRGPRRRSSIDINILNNRKTPSVGTSTATEKPASNGAAAAAAAGDLEVLQLTLPRWYKLDRSSAWEEYGRGVEQFAPQIKAFKPDVVLGVDWTSTLALQTLRSLGVLREVPSIYLNFRVFSSSTSISEEDAAFYREREALAVRTSQLSVALCEHDAQLLRDLVGNDSHGRSISVLNPPLRSDMRLLAMRQARVSRDAARQLILFRRSLSDSREVFDSGDDANPSTDRSGPRSRSMDGAPEEISSRIRNHAASQPLGTLLERQNSVTSMSSSASSTPRASWSSDASAGSKSLRNISDAIGGGYSTKVISTIPRIGSFGSREDLGRGSASSHVQHGFGGPRPLVLTYLKSRKANLGRYGFRRNLVTCCCRICPEKNVQVFVEVMIRLKDFLREHHLEPCLVGPPTDEAFANRLYLELDRAFPGTSSKVIPKFVSSRELGEIFGRTVLNVHPALYEAYGMTIVEAGAFGAPTLMHGDGEIGAQDLLSAPRRAILGDMSSPKRAAALVKSLLQPERRDILASVGTEAFGAAIRWDDEAFAAALSSQLERAVLDRFKLRNTLANSSSSSSSSLHGNGHGFIDADEASEMGSPLPPPPPSSDPAGASSSLWTASTSSFWSPLSSAQPAAEPSSPNGVEPANGLARTERALGSDKVMGPEEADICAGILDWARASATSTGRAIHAGVKDARVAIERLGEYENADLASSIEQEFARLLEQESEALRLTEAAEPTFSQAKATLRARLDAAKAPRSGDWANFLITLPVVAEVRYQLVPSRLPEVAFWAILFGALAEDLLRASSV